MLKLLPLVVFAAIAGFLWRGLSLDPGKLPSALIDRPAPTFSVATLADRPGRGTAADGAAATASAPAPSSTAVSAGASGATGTLSAPDTASSPLDASRFDSRSMAGRVWLLNVWASWCGPCAQEHPQLVALAAAREVPIVGLNYKDDPDDARAWLARHGDVFDEVLSDVDGRVGIDWGVYGVPETFVIDAAGRVRYKHVGPILPDDLERAILPALDALAAAS